MYNRISYGSHSKYLAVTSDLTRREFFLLLPLLMATLILGVYPGIILNSLHLMASSLIYHT
jgi:NADH-ubiquinone oxidoreductase chain 4